MQDVKHNPSVRGNPKELIKPDEDNVYVCAAVSCGHLIRGDLGELVYRVVKTGQKVHAECQELKLSTINI